MKPTLVLAFLALTVIPCRAQAQTIKVPFTVTSTESGPGLLLVPVAVDGKSYTFVLDSGATGIIVSPRVAKNKPILGETALCGMNGLTHSRIVRVTLQVGGMSEDSVVDVQDLRGVSYSVATRIDGILGESFLAQFKSVKIDYVNRLIIMEE